MLQPASYIDAETLIKGEKLGSILEYQVRRLMCHKDTDWLNNLFTSDFRPKIKGVSEHVRKELNLAQYEKSMLENFHPAKIDIGNEAQNIKRTSAYVLQNPDRNDLNYTLGNRDSIVDQAVSIIAGAKKQVDLVSPYIFLTTDEKLSLMNWLKEDINRKLRIITTSRLTSDNPPAQALIEEKLAPKMMEALKAYGNQVEFYSFGRLDASELDGTVVYGQLHSKFAIIDGKISLVTSSNADPRSRYLNSEVGAFIESEAFAQELTREFDSLRDRSYLWDSEDWHKLKSHKNLIEKEKKINKAKRFLKRLRATEVFI